MQFTPPARPGQYGLPANKKRVVRQTYKVDGAGNRYPAVLMTRPKAGHRTDGVAKATAKNLARDVLGKDGRVADKAGLAIKAAVDKYIEEASKRLKKTAVTADKKTATGHVRDNAFDEPILGFKAPPEVLSAYAGATKRASGSRGIPVATAHKALADVKLRAGQEASELVQRLAEAYGKALSERASSYTQAAGRKTLFPQDVAAALKGSLSC